MLVLLSDIAESMWLLFTEPMRRLLSDAFYDALRRAEQDHRRVCGTGEVHWGEVSGGALTPPAWAPPLVSPRQD